jgi:phosphatidate cytidylyltransferase
VNRNLAVRLLTAAILAPLLLWVMFGAAPWAWFIVIAAACGIGGYELFGMTHPLDRVAQGIGVVLTLGVSVGIYFGAHDPRALISIVLAVCVVGGLVPLWRLGNIDTAGLRIMAGIAGPFYVGALMTSVALLRRDMVAFDGSNNGAEWVVLVLSLAWVGDTSGYFVGRFLGKNKLYPAVSPKKTREGYFGAVGGSVLAAVVASLWYLPELEMTHAVVLGLVAGFLGPLGDLVESLLKRSTGVKDSGSIIPGHGGILDRVDAVLIIAPIVYTYTLWTTG